MYFRVEKKLELSPTKNNCDSLERWLILGLGEEKHRWAWDFLFWLKERNLSETSEAIHMSLRDTAAVPKGAHGLKKGQAE